MARNKGAQGHVDVTTAGFSGTTVMALLYLVTVLDLEVVRLGDRQGAMGL
ncbi:MAG: hypothetical protein QF681_13185 [Vicinamibacterales bacterium]|jgi:hypothetical protein|nr:hypothetical protein [Vicinamibacterales bacterium]